MSRFADSSSAAPSKFIQLLRRRLVPTSAHLNSPAAWAQPLVARADRRAAVGDRGRMGPDRKASPTMRGRRGRCAPPPARLAAAARSRRTKKMIRSTWSDSRQDLPRAQEAAASVPRLPLRRRRVPRSRPESPGVDAQPSPMQEIDHVSEARSCCSGRAGVFRSRIQPARHEVLQGGRDGAPDGGSGAFDVARCRRPIEQFGLVGWIGPQPLPIALAAAGWALFLASAAWALLTRFRSPVARFYSDYAHLMPHSRKELPVAYGTAGLAGFGEEIAYRGFLLWYVTAGRSDCGDARL